MILLGWLLVCAAVAGEAEEAFDRGDYSAAIEAWGDAMEGARRVGDLERLHDLHLRIAAAHRRLGQPVMALDWLEQARMMSQSDAQRARELLDEGLVRHELGQLRKAHDLVERAFRLYRKQEDPAGAALAALNLGRLRLDLGRLEEASKAMTVAGTLFEALADVEGGLATQHLQARLARARGDLPAARDLLEGVLADTRHQVSGTLEDALSLLAIVEEDLGRAEVARNHLNTALADAYSRDDHRRRGALLVQRAGLELRSGTPEQAGRSYSEAAGAYRLAGATREAVRAELQGATISDDVDAVEAVQDRAASLGLQEVEALAALHRARAGEAAALDVARRLREASPEVALQVQWLEGREQLRSGALGAAERSLRAVFDAVEQRRVELAPGGRGALVQAYRELYADLADCLVRRGKAKEAFVVVQRMGESDAHDPVLHELAEERAALEARLGQDAGGREARVLKEELAALRVAFAERVDALKAENPGLAEVVRIDPADLEAIQADLDPGVVVLQPILLEDRVVLLVFRRERLVPIEVKVGRDDLVRDIRRLSRSMQAGYVLDPTWTAALTKRLGRYLLEPIAHELESADILVVSASGALRELPFAMLQVNDRYLVEQAAVVNITHVGSLRRSQPLAFDDSELLLVGNPDDTLQGAELEVRQIQKNFPGATVLVGDEATRKALYRRAEKTRVLHLATHGIIDPEHPDRSYLVLAGDSGRLSYKEIPALSTWLGHARLVVLSACESGRPVSAPRDEGDGPVVVSIEGLAAQFRRAGVETLVASLWKVDDEGTRTLMDRFYRRLAKGEDVARALAGAQRDLLSQRGYAHPWFWSGFVVTGDWR